MREVIVGKATVRAQHLDEDLEVEPPVSVGSRLKDLVPVEVLVQRVDIGESRGSARPNKARVLRTASS
ncbi:MAG TPA: hypothetical protein VLI04_03465 [Nocardioidaceae bacterium]|nr:hypothetical protein [Nocardioidaceae bacterium]